MIRKRGSLITSFLTICIITWHLVFQPKSKFQHDRWIDRIVTNSDNASFLNKSDLVDMVSPLYDQTVAWNSSVYRPWMDQKNFENPPAMILLTNFAWNHPNQTFALTQYRCHRSTELYCGVINHPWFHPTAWEDINFGKMRISNSTRYYVFLDFDTCFESHYPKYGYGKFYNRDQVGNRSQNFPDRLSFFQAISQSPIMNATHVQIVVFDCEGGGPNQFLRRLRNGISTFTQQNLIYVSISNTRAKAGTNDQGLPPPALRKFYLSPKEEDDIKYCNESARPILISFSGHLRRAQTRHDLFSIRNGTQVLVLRDQKAQSYFNVSDPGLAYSKLATMSSFSAVGRGDNLFSYRFSEVMACGSIPVVYADDWMLPFGDALINWTEVAVVIREADTLNTVSILSNISLEDRCKRRQRALQIYRKYIETGTGTIDGIIETLERSAKRNLTMIG